MIQAPELTKRYGEKVTVDALTFTVQPGVVTGFLGPNGAGKSTTMRMILGLDQPSSGSVTVNGRPYAEHRQPLHEVGALLEADVLEVEGLTGAQIGDEAHALTVRLHELTPKHASLEEAFMDMTRDEVEYQVTTPDRVGL